MRRSLVAVALTLAACSGPSGEAPADPPAGDPAPAPEAPAPPPPPENPTPAWLRTLLAHDLREEATDGRTVALGRRLRAPVECPQPGTGCFVRLPLAGYTTQLHLADDQAIQIWGPIEPSEMPAWVAGIERAIDRSTLEPVNEPGTRPDRMWRGHGRIVLLHDHSEQACGGFCPAMVWIALPDHRAAAGYGFPPP